MPSFKQLAQKLSKKIELKAGKQDENSYHIASRQRNENENLTGLSVEQYGRMGNNLLQISNALLLAKALRLEYVKLPKSEIFSVSHPVTVEGLTLLPHDVDTRTYGSFLVSDYFQQPRLELLGVRMPIRRKVLKKYLAPAVKLVYPNKEPAGCLTIHLRSGDVFSSNPHPDYAPPPLAFYKVVIEDSLKNLAIDRVRLVFQDERNPCVNALKEYLSKLPLSVSLQSGSLEEDFKVLMSARNLVFGYGTFGVGICLLSEAAETVNAFGISGYAYQQFNSLQVSRVWDDMSGKYPGKGEWTASPAQLELMLRMETDAIRETTETPPLHEQHPLWFAVPEIDI